MDHAHHHHMDHGDMDMCSMSMLLNWDVKNVCIVSSQWHIRTTFDLIASLVAVVLIAAGYEALRAATRKYELAVTRRVDSAPRRNQPEISRQAKTTKAALYALQNFYAFMLMLVFMTYNGWIMISVSLGAFVGYLLFGESTSATKDNACH